MRFLLLGLVLASMSACAGMMASWRAANCHYDGAYTAGMNDAREGKPMQPQFASSCEAPKRAEVARGYREGFTAGAGGTVMVAGSTAPTKQWKCEQAYGKKACGYECIEAYGNIACAQDPNHNCVEAYGKIRCGANCRSEFGKIVCDQ